MVRCNHNLLKDNSNVRLLGQTFSRCSDRPDLPESPRVVPRFVLIVFTKRNQLNHSMNVTILIFSRWQW